MSKLTDGHKTQRSSDRERIQLQTFGVVILGAKWLSVQSILYHFLYIFLGRAWKALRAWQPRRSSKSYLAEWPGITMTMATPGGRKPLPSADHERLEAEGRKRLPSLPGCRDPWRGGSLCAASAMRASAFGRERRSPRARRTIARPDPFNEKLVRSWGSDSLVSAAAPARTASGPSI